nr:ankyrin repeat domain-containing protein [Wolbachia endosymbiont of Oedothorax gibbosus]
MLLERGIDPNMQDENGKIPLHEALFGEHCSTAELLLKHGADLNRNSDVLLHTLFLSGCYKAVELLLKRNVDPNIRDEYGDVLLHKAFYREHYKPQLRIRSQ